MATHFKKNIALYLRVSTTDQSTSLQEADLRDFSARSNFNIVRVYKDVTSGAKQSRPQLDKLMRDARRRLFSTVLVWRFDRFARSTRHLTLALEEFQSLDIDFISYQESIDTSTPMGKAMFTVISAMAQLERDIISERVQSGLKNAQRKGKQIGRPKLRDDEKIKELRNQGLSYGEISKALHISRSAVQRSLKTSL